MAQRPAARPAVSYYLKRNLGPAVYRKNKYPATKNNAVRANMKPTFSAMVNTPELYALITPSPCRSADLAGARTPFQVADLHYCSTRCQWAYHMPAAGL